MAKYFVNIKESPWFFRFGSLLTFMFAVGTMVLNGKGHMRTIGIMFAVYGLYLLLFDGKNDYDGKFPPELKMYTIYVVWTLLSGLIVTQYWVLFWHLSKILWQMLVMIWSAEIMMRHEKGDIRYIFFAFFIGACIQVLGCYLGFNTDIGHNRELVREVVEDTQRLRGLSMNENELGEYMIIGIVSSMLLWNWRFLLPKRIFKVSIMIMMSFFVYYAMRAGSRQAILFIAMMFLGWSMIALPKLVNRGAKTLVMVMASVVVLVSGGIVFKYMMDNTVVGTRIQQHMDSGGVVGGMKENIRLFLILRAFEVWLEHPIAGVGHGQYQAYSQTGLYSHSDFAESLACNGIVGFVLYQSWAFIVLIRLFRLGRLNSLTRDEQYLVIVLLFYLGVKFFISNWFTPHWAHQGCQLLLAFISAYTWKLQRKYISY